LSYKLSYKRVLLIAGVVRRQGGALESMSRQLGGDLIEYEAAQDGIARI
jgi:hypothetical protein